MALSEFQSSTLKFGNPFRGDMTELCLAIDSGDVIFHEGHICGAWPRII